MNKRSAVYWIYDAEDRLLYVGVSVHFGRRWDQHARVQPWWPMADHQTVRWYASREDAELAEKVAIHDEGPIHNIRDSPWEKRVKDDGTGFYVVPKPPRVPKPRNPNAIIDETPIQRFRTPLAAWTAFGQMCKRRGMIRARHLFDLMWADIKRHGTDEEKAIFAAADEELRARRSRRPSS